MEIKKLRVFALVLALFFMFLSWTNYAQASLMLEISERDLANNADLIISGTVKGMNSKWNRDRSNIYTELIIAVEKVIGDDHAGLQEVIVINPGGTVGPVGQSVSVAPEFRVGEKILLYLQDYAAENDLVRSGVTLSEYDKPLYTVYGHFQGKKEITNNRIEGVSINEFETKIKSYRQEQTFLESSLNIPGTADTSPVGVVRNNYTLTGQKWPQNAIPVPYRVNTSGGPAGSLNAIQGAATTWSNAGANFSFIYDGSHSRSGLEEMNDINEILFYNLGNTPTLGYAYTSYETVTNYIVEVDIIFNTFHAFNTDGSIYDLETVALHEFGHSLGLDHSSIPAATMYESYQVVRRTLHADDIAGIKEIYGSLDTTYTLTMVANPTAGGTATDETDTGPYEAGTSINIKAVPNENYTFTGWSAPVGSFANANALETTFTMPAQNVTVTANFTSPEDPEPPTPTPLPSPGYTPPKPKLPSDPVKTELYQQISEGLMNSLFNIRYQNEYSAMINPNETTSRQSVYAPGSRDLFFGLAWSEDKLKLSVYDPRGNLFKTLESSSPPLTLVVQNAQAGNWTFTVSGVNLPQHNVPFLMVSGDFLYGDLNDDQKLNILDINAVIRHALELELMPAVKTTIADVNGDGKIDVRDATLLMQKTLRLIDKFPLVN